MATAFLAMKEVYGTDAFRVSEAEARNPEMMLERANALSGQFIFDDQTHFLRDDFGHEAILGLGEFAAEHWNPKLKEEGVTLERYKFENYVRELWYNSDTKMALLSGAPFDDPTWWLLSNDQIVRARDMVNDFAGSKRMLGHAVITPRPARLDGGGGPRDRGTQAEFLEVLHHRRPARAVEISVAARRRGVDVSLLREIVEGGHQHHLHPQGPAAAGLRAVVPRRVGTRHRVGHRARPRRTGRR